VSDELPQPSVDRLCAKPNAWKKPIPPLAWIVLLVTGIGAGIFAVVATPRPASPPAPVVQAPPPQSHTVIEYTESTGGKEHVKGNATGASLSLSGEKVEAKDMVIAPTDMTLFDVGSLTGGAFSGSFKASVSGQFWIRMLGLLAFVGCGAGAVLSFKKTPLDWHQWGGLAVGALAGLVVAVQPELFWVGLGGLAIAAALNFFPSRQAGALLSAGQEYEDFLDAPGNEDIKARWVKHRQQVPTKDKNTIDNLIKRTNT